MPQLDTVKGVRQTCQELERLGRAARVFEVLFLWEHRLIDPIAAAKELGRPKAVEDEAVVLLETIRDGLIERHARAGG